MKKYILLIFMITKSLALCNAFEEEKVQFFYQIAKNPLQFENIFEHPTFNYEETYNWSELSDKYILRMMQKYSQNNFKIKKSNTYLQKSISENETIEEDSAELIQKFEGKYDESDLIFMIYFVKRGTKWNFQGLSFEVDQDKNSEQRILRGKLLFDIIEKPEFMDSLIKNSIYFCENTSSHFFSDRNYDNVKRMLVDYFSLNSKLLYDDWLYVFLDEKSGSKWKLYHKIVASFEDKDSGLEIWYYYSDSDGKWTFDQIVIVEIDKVLRDINYSKMYHESIQIIEGVIYYD